MSSKLVLYFKTEQGKIFNLSVPHCKNPSALTKQLLSTNMDKIIEANAVETGYGNIVAKEKAVITQTTVTTLL